MATYTYTGRLTDVAEEPFIPGASPRLLVAPEREAFTSSGVAVSRSRVVPVTTDGWFSIELVASADLVPPTRYVLRCDWFTTGVGGEQVLAGWSEWRFAAAIGGGPISTMPGVEVTRVWYATTPPPVNRPGIYWINPVTGDIREWSD